MTFENVRSHWCDFDINDSSCRVRVDIWIIIYKIGTRLFCILFLRHVFLSALSHFPKSRHIISSKKIFIMYVLYRNDEGKLKKNSLLFFLFVSRTTGIVNQNYQPPSVYYTSNGQIEQLRGQVNEVCDKQSTQKFMFVF